uniref:Uncharacterized protein n=1 Tax=Oryza glumipatula TaxID=40148 RepID=A0A0D9YSK5_9ORYZ
MPISLYVAALAGILEGFRRGGRGDDDGATARPDLVHGGRRDDGDAAVALGARSRASECAVAFLFNRCMEWDEIRWNGDGIKSRLRNAKEEETTAAPWHWRPSSSRWPAMEMRAMEPSASSALDTSRPCVEHAQSSVGSDSLRSLSVSLFSCRLREVNKCKDKPTSISYLRSPHRQNTSIDSLQGWSRGELGLDISVPLELASDIDSKFEWDTDVEVETPSVPGLRNVDATRVCKGCEGVTGFVAAALLIAGLDLGQIREEGDGREEGEDPERILHLEAHRRPCLAIADVAPIHSSVSAALPPHNPFRD